MIPPLTDAALGGTAPPPPVVMGEASPRFADFLGAIRAAATASDDTPDTQARLFNQDGFFGQAQPWAVANPVQPVAMPQPSPLAIADGEIPIAVEATPSIPDHGPERTAGRNALRPLPDPVVAESAHVVKSDTRTLVRTAPLPPPPPRPVEEALPGTTPRGPAPVRRPVPPPNAMVAVALHGTARGMEVAAQVAGLDERDRAALAEEVAALLSAHGYAPARISIIAAVGADHREPR
ncbi:hypothetical protein N4G62_12240 [Sphingomonas sanguinis]|uniref:Flagellar hook-length control protein-like C-terminal domain-containing protein n=1 Tax=Sphingomonas sanguinis TaxID=33051 RepID=A0ABU5LS95_9SPHN|nr:hypothetical protein [Sphingomonas sanguinis]MDZ7282797.1 hypothetical protein [Sphingomonas sanguinis]